MSSIFSPSSTKAKLRSSCESCGNSKVKCDRGQPECARCRTLGLTCVYGISRKFGKPPRKRLDARSKAEKQSMMAVGLSQEANDSLQHNSSSNPKSLPVNFSTSTMSGQQIHPGSVVPTPLAWPQLDMWAADFDFPSLSNDPADPTFEPTNNASASFDSSEFHSCPKGSYELFRDLICPAPFLHAPNSSLDMVSAQLDQVLHFNSNAIDRLNRLLECSCAKSGHRIMVHASIISRILIWYQQAAVPSSTSPVSSSTSEVLETGMTQPAMLAQSTGFAVDQSPILVGSFTVDDQNLQTAIRIQLVLSELKSVGSVIELFTKHDPKDCSDHGAIGLYLSLGAWLQNELSRTVDMLKDRLSEVQNSLPPISISQQPNETRYHQH